MAKTKSAPDRQAVIDKMRKQQARAEKRRGLTIVVVCAVVAVVIVVASAWQPLSGWWQARQYADLTLDEIGAAPAVCGNVRTRDAEGNQDHVAETQQVIYDHAPPVYGSHWNVAGLAPDPMGRKVYTAEDRPELEALVHNLEHGYTILWYDESVAADDEAMETIRAMASKLSGTSNMRDRFKAVPWTAEDEAESGTFPDGRHVALTHWSAGGAGETDTSLQQGVWQYCDAASGEALSTFMTDYPYYDSPEPNGM